MSPRPSASPGRMASSLEGSLFFAVKAPASSRQHFGQEDFKGFSEDLFAGFREEEMCDSGPVMPVHLGPMGGRLGRMCVRMSPRKDCQEDGNSESDPMFPQQLGLAASECIIATAEVV